MRNVSEKSSRENENTHFVFNNFFPKFVPFMRYGKILDSRADHRRQYGACELHAGYLRLHIYPTHSEYVIIIAFPLQQPLHERVSMFYYTYVAYIFKNNCLEFQVYFSFIVLFNGALSYWGYVASSVDEWMRVEDWWNVSDRILFVIPYVYLLYLMCICVSYVYLLYLMCICVSYVCLLYLMCICCILCVFVVSYVYLCILCVFVVLLCVFVVFMRICCTLMCICCTMYVLLFLL